MQYLSEKEFRAIITAIHAVSQRQLPVILFGAGLPQLVGLAGKAKSYAERLFLFPELGPLSPNDAVEALRAPVQSQQVDFADDALEKIYELTEGYPYFIQEWGYELWNLSAISPISSQEVANATPIIIRKLDKNFFRVRFDRLTPAEKRYLRAMAELGRGEHRSGEIASLIGAKVQSAAPLRNSLIKKGMIYSPSHGETAFTVPLRAFGWTIHRAGRELRMRLRASLRWRWYNSKKADRGSPCLKGMMASRALRVRARFRAALGLRCL
jgi:hypothetical protein